MLKLFRNTTIAYFFFFFWRNNFLAIVKKKKKQKKKYIKVSCSCPTCFFLLVIYFAQDFSFCQSIFIKSFSKRQQKVLFFTKGILDPKGGNLRRTKLSHCTPLSNLLIIFTSILHLCFSFKVFCLYLFLYLLYSEVHLL